MTTETLPTTDDRTFCANHPDRETSLRCNRCGKYICAKCARRTPTGYRCKECVTQQQQVFETAEWYDLVIGFAVAFVLSAIAGALVSILAFFVIFIAPVAGSLIARVVTMAVRKRRSKYLPWLAAAGAVLGGLALCALPVLAFGASMLMASRMDPDALAEGGGLGAFAMAGIYASIWPLVYSGLCGTTVFYSLRGIRLR